MNLVALKKKLLLCSVKIINSYYLLSTAVFHRVEVDKSVIYSLESTVIKWIHQIHRVLRKDSSEVLLERRKLMPQTELLFWKNRSEPWHCSDWWHSFKKKQKKTLMWNQKWSGWCSKLIGIYDFCHLIYLLLIVMKWITQYYYY